MKTVYVGYDPREAEGFAVTRHSFSKGAPHIPIRGLYLSKLRDKGLYYRPTSKKDSQLWDEISDAPMATEFSISRFLTPILAKTGWALFVDCDVLARQCINKLFALADPKYAVMCVQHVHNPSETVKMDNQIQTRYARKNWSSVMLFNVDHPSNARLTVDLINSVPGRDLHRFCWLEDDEIGALPPEWNFLVGHSDPSIDPAIVHFTDGLPTMAGYENVPYADEWRAACADWVCGERDLQSLREDIRRAC